MQAAVTGRQRHRRLFWLEEMRHNRNLVGVLLSHMIWYMDVAGGVVVGRVFLGGDKHLATLQTEVGSISDSFDSIEPWLQLQSLTLVIVVDVHFHPIPPIKLRQGETCRRERFDAHNGRTRDGHGGSGGDRAVVFWSCRKHMGFLQTEKRTQQVLHVFLDVLKIYRTLYHRNFKTQNTKIQ